MFLSESNKSLLAVVLTGAAFVVAAGGANAESILSGPYVGEVERVVDGDTLAVKVTVWLDQDLRVLVRLRGIDAPELRGGCDGEKVYAEAARVGLARLVAGGVIVLTQIEGDKYYGRVVADVDDAEGKNIGQALVAGGFARAYAGGARESWCEIGRREADALAQTTN